MIVHFESIFLCSNFGLTFESKAKLRIYDGHKVEREKHAEDAYWFQVQIFRVVKSVSDAKRAITNFVNSILFLDDDYWPTPEIKGSEVLAGFDRIRFDGSNQFKFNVFCSFR